MVNEKSKLTKHELNELRKAASKAFKQVIDSIKHEPSTIIITGEPNGESEATINEITQWLFHRRQNNDSTGN
jgi:hypothetical protein